MEIRGRPDQTLETVLVTVEQAAAMLSIGRTAAYDLVRRKELASVRIGNSRRVVVASIIAYVKRLLED